MRNQLTAQVEHVLRVEPETRNDDIRLTISIWRTYYRHLLFFNEDHIGFVSLNNLFQLPREDHIKRIRAKIQNEKFRYLPTNIEVVRQRRINEERWHEAMRRPDTL